MADKSIENASKDDIIHRLEEIVMCSVCRETFKDPKVLRCGHSFCAACIENVYHMSEYTNCVPCPVCRDSAFPPDNAISNFPRNTYIQAVLDILKREESLQLQSGSQCEFCEARIIVNICIECSLKMCKKCTSIHNKSNNNSHTVLSISEIQGTTLSDFLNEKAKYKFCPDHGEQELNRFCEMCDALLCDRCVILHNDCHYVSTIEEAASGMNDYLESKIKESGPEIKALRQKSKTLREDHDLLDTTTNETKHQIQKSATELRHLINAQEQECNKETDDIHRKQSKHIQDLLEAVEIQLVKRTVLLEKMKCLQKYGTNLLLAKHKKAISNELEELQEQTCERAEYPDQEEFKLSFTRNAKLFETAKLSRIGKVINSSSELDSAEHMLVSTNIRTDSVRGVLRQSFPVFMGFESSCMRSSNAEFVILYALMLFIFCVQNIYKSTF